MKIAIVPLAGTRIAEQIFFEIPKYFPLDFKFSYLDSLPIPIKSFNPERKQYDSTVLMEFLKDVANANNFTKAIGVANVDIYCKNSSFVFGHAELNGTSAVVSVYRLDGDGNVINRGIKEVMHELGHLLGLKHCNNNCVMRFSETLEQLDNKSINYCKRCLKILESKNI